MQTHLKTLVAVLILLVLSLPVAQAEKRLALVIGNAAYTEISPLANPKSDATLIAKTLRSVGFEVKLATDLEIRAMARAMRTFGRKLRLAGEDAVGFFYFAGHGIQARGTNYLIPLGAQIDNEVDLEIEALNLSNILAQMESAGNALNMIVLDACRNNPYGSVVRSNTRGLARISAASGTLVAFSAAPGQVALDGEGENSPYTKALAEAIQVEGVAIEQMFKRVRVQVENQTGKQQTPWEESSLRGDFYFVPDEPERTVTEREPEVPEIKVPRVGNDAIELAYWQSIKDSRRKEPFEAYLRRFPNGVFTELAELKLEEFAEEKKPPPETKTPPEPIKTAKRTAKDEEQPIDVAPRNTAPLNTAPINNAPLNTAPAVRQPQAEDWSDPKKLARAIQTELERHGCEPGKIDGAWGANSRKAYQEFTRLGGLASVRGPSVDMLQQLRDAKDTVCQLTMVAKVHSDSTKQQPNTRSDRVDDFSRISEAKRILYNLNYNVGERDGVMNTETRNAIREYQGNMNVAQTGELTEALLRELRSQRIPTTWGALSAAVDGAWGASWNYGTREDAERTALEECRKNTSEKCEAIAVLDTKCSAMYHWQTDKNWGWRIDTGNDVEDAKRKTLKACNVAKEQGSTCTFRTVVCANGRHPQ